MMDPHDDPAMAELLAKIRTETVLAERELDGCCLQCVGRGLSAVVATKACYGRDLAPAEVMMVAAVMLACVGNQRRDTVRTNAMMVAVTKRVHEMIANPDGFFREAMAEGMPDPAPDPVPDLADVPPAGTA